jgi:hypothetical protein
MAYNNFTLATAKHQFNLNLIDAPFCESLPTADPQPAFITIFQQWLPLAQRAKSEIEAPVVMLVEAKKGELDIGLGQCVAEMVAAQIFNQKVEQDAETIYGSVTSGKQWQFLKLNGKDVTIDANEYPVMPIQRILGILKWMVEN